MVAATNAGTKVELVQYCTSRGESSCCNKEGPESLDRAESGYMLVGINKSGKFVAWARRAREFLEASGQGIGPFRSFSLGARGRDRMVQVKSLSTGRIDSKHDIEGDIQSVDDKEKKDTPRRRWICWPQYQGTQ